MVFKEDLQTPLVFTASYFEGQIKGKLGKKGLEGRGYGIEDFSEDFIFLLEVFL